jgi:RimJ/RimL family protein N-acetyltransferase
MSRQGRKTEGEVMGEQPVVLTDDVVTLRGWEMDDAPAVYEACQDRLISRFVPVPMPYTEDAARQFIIESRADWDNGSERSFAITDTATGEVLGSIARHGPWAHRAQFGYWSPSPPAVVELPRVPFGSSPTGHSRPQT